MANLGICTQAVGNHSRVHCERPDIRVVYKGGTDSGVQLEPDVVGSEPHTGGGGQRRQQRGGG